MLVGRLQPWGVACAKARCVCLHAQWENWEDNRLGGETTVLFIAHYDNDTRSLLPKDGNHLWLITITGILSYIRQAFSLHRLELVRDVLSFSLISPSCGKSKSYHRSRISERWAKEDEERLFACDSLETPSDSKRRGAYFHWCRSQGCLSPISLLHRLKLQQKNNSHTINDRTLSLYQCVCQLMRLQREALQRFGRHWRHWCSKRQGWEERWGRGKKKEEGLYVHCAIVAHSDTAEKAMTAVHSLSPLHYKYTTQ